MFKTYLAISLTLLVSACAGDKSVSVKPLQKKDKNLSCKEIQLEINEAEFYRKTAEKNKNPGVKSILMPLGYISTYVDAEGAAGAATARIDYLNRIYEIMKCDEQQEQAKQQRMQPMQPQMMTPVEPRNARYPNHQLMPRHYY